MLQLLYSNRYETLVDALLDDLHAASRSPWAADEVIVPSAAVRRRIELDVAARHGVCANMKFSYLAQWLWAQIGGVIPVPEHSPLAPERLAWRCYRLFCGEEAGPGEAGGAAWRASPNPPGGLPSGRGTSFGASPRLASYLDAADAPMRYELARRVATVLDHYLTYRPEWLSDWQHGKSIFEAGDVRRPAAQGHFLRGAGSPLGGSPPRGAWREGDRFGGPYS